MALLEVDGIHGPGSLQQAVMEAIKTHQQHVRLDIVHSLHAVLAAAGGPLPRTAAALEKLQQAAGLEGSPEEAKEQVMSLALP